MHSCIFYISIFFPLYPAVVLVSTFTLFLLASVCRFSSHVIYSNLFSIFSHFFIYIASSVLVFLYFASSFVLLLSSLFSLFSPFWLILSSALYLFFFFSSLLCPVWHPYFTVVFSSNLLALKWSYQLSRIFYWPYLFFPLYCMCLCAFCVHFCVSLWRRKKRCCRIRPLPALHYLFFFLVFFFLFLLFFPACSPPLHQGRSSPGAEIQFRSSSSAFCALTCSDSECALSYLLPAQIERLGAGSSPCFHAVLSGCYSCVLRPTVRVYGRPGAAQQAQDH